MYLFILHDWILQSYCPHQVTIKNTSGPVWMIKPLRMISAGLMAIRWWAKCYCVVLFVCDLQILHDTLQERNNTGKRRMSLYIVALWKKIDFRSHKLRVYYTHCENVCIVSIVSLEKLCQVCENNPDDVFRCYPRLHMETAGFFMFWKICQKVSKDFYIFQTFALCIIYNQAFLKLKLEYLSFR